MTGELLRVAAILIISAVFILLIKPYRPEIGMIITVAAVSVVMTIILAKLSPVVSELVSLFERSGVDAGYFKVVLKALGIAYLSGFAADTCRDFGMASLAAKAEFAGRCAILVMSLPILSEILNTALEFAGV